jgi:2'-5' RNA ligase
VARLFYALDVDEASRAALTATLRRLAHDPPRGVRVLPPEAVHLTLKFLGEIEEALVAQLSDALEPLARGAGLLPARAKELTGFPHAARARVGVLELVDPAGSLTALAGALDAHAAAFGVAVEGRAFRPHLTLARARAARDLRAWLARVEPPRALAFAALVLYESKTLPTGPVYTARARAVLR